MRITILVLFMFFGCASNTQIVKENHLRICPFCGRRAVINSKCSPMWMLCENKHEWWAINRMTITIKNPEEGCK